MTEVRDKEEQTHEETHHRREWYRHTLSEDGLYYPDLKLPEGTDYPIGRYGRMRCKYLKEHYKIEYRRLFLNGRLNEYLYSVDEDAYQMMELLIEQMKELQGITEQLKADNQMQWVRIMSNISHSAEELVLKEIVYRQYRYGAENCSVL